MEMLSSQIELGVYAWSLDNEVLHREKKILGGPDIYIEVN